MVFRPLTGSFLTDIIKKKYNPNLFYFQFSVSSVMYEISFRLLQIFINFFPSLVIVTQTLYYDFH